MNRPVYHTDLNGVLIKKYYNLSSFRTNLAIDKYKRNLVKGLKDKIVFKDGEELRYKL